jgi:hypothetical protein
MGDPDSARVDVGALLGVARQYDVVAGLVDDAVRNHLSGLAFDGAGAGRVYVARGEAVRGAVDDVVAQLRGWSRAAAEIAAALRVSTDRYVEADSRAAQRVG